MTLAFADRQGAWGDYLRDMHMRLPQQPLSLLPSGRLVRMVGLVLEAEGLMPALVPAAVWMPPSSGVLMPKW